MYHRRRYRQTAGTEESYEARRVRRKLARRRAERTLFIVIILGPVALFIVYELGRSLFYMREVNAFAQRIEQLSSAEVKLETRRFAQGLTSLNPLIRNGSIAALKVATGWRLGPDAAEWKQWWDAREAMWEYRPRGLTNAPPKPEIDWRKELLPGTNQPAPETPVPPP